MTCEVFSAAEVAQAGGEGVLVIRGLQPAYRSAAVCGPAVTCSCDARDNLALHHALLSAPANGVLVCDAGGRQDGGYFGELMALDAGAHGVAGLVIDGSVRDLAELEKLRFPIFHRGSCPHSCGKEHGGSVGEPVTVGGVRVSPGDQIVADIDAAVVIPRDRWPRVRDGACAVQERERKIRAALADGSRLASLISVPQ